MARMFNTIGIAPHESNNHWRKYPEEKPPKENERYLCYLGYGIQEVCGYSCGQWLQDFVVEAWMELPQPPKF